MSQHSRSSSEVETIQYREILPVFMKDYIKDFSFSDVKLRVRECELFTNDEYEAIINEIDEKRTIRRLFWVLCQDEAKIPKFLKAIRYDHEWLVKKVDEERHMQHKNTESYVEALRILRSNNQKHTDYNIHRMKYYEPLCRALKSLKSHKYVVLTGELGMGKKWLAIDVCTDYEVQRCMDFKIYWIDVSQCTSREADLNALQQLRLKLGDSNISLSPAASGSIYRPNLQHFDNISNRKLELQQYLSCKFRQEEYKNALVILVDVQNIKTWETFNLGCKLLLITRNKKVSESLSASMTTHIDIGCGLTLTEFYSLFERYLGCSRNEFPNNATDIYDHSQGHPYLLCIIAQNMHQRKSHNWDEWINNVQNFRYLNNRFTNVIELSLNVLQPDQLELYAVFAIFPNCIVIPVKLIAALWNKRLHDAEKIIHKFHTHSLVNEDVFSNGTMGCSVPFIYSSHLKDSTIMQSKINCHELHRKVIEYYKIEESIKYRTEIDLCNSHHDQYFYKCIGYHINEANCKHLFPLLYLDFGFLGQMIRVVKLLHTIADLKCYREEIVDNDQRRRSLLSDLLEFLPKIEDMLVRSEDTCLLQYALMTTGCVREEALKQVERFPKRVWLNEIGLFHQRRQIVTLPNKPKLLKFLEADICLINLENNDMLLVDLSLDFNNGHIFLSNEGSKVIEVQLIRDNNFIVTLGARGELKLWSIRDDRRRNLVRRRSSKQKVNPLNFNHFLTNKHGVRKCKQNLHESNVGIRSEIVSFYIDQLPERNNFETDLHVAYANGDVSMFKWDDKLEEFEVLRSFPTLHTGDRDTRFLCKILLKYYMMLSITGSISFWNLRDSSRAAVSFEWPKDTSNLICYELHTATNYTSIIFIFGLKILRLTFKHQTFAVLIGQLETLYECTDPQSAITCGRLTRNGRYLVLGTKRGLIIFDTYAKSEILRSNVSEAISCVDIFSLDDKNYKYIIVCGSEKTKILNIFSLRDAGEGSVTFAHNVAEISCEASERPQLEANVWLLGHKLYDVIYTEDTTLLFAADSKDRLHQICTTDTKNWTIVTPTENVQHITAITACEHNSFIAYDNGAIFNVTKDAFEQDDEKFTENPIDFLQLINDNILVASSWKYPPLTQVRNLQNDTKFPLRMETVQCYLLCERYLLLINELGFFMVLDVENQFKILHKVDTHKDNEIGNYKLGGCDLKNGRLFIGTTTFNIYVYNFIQNDENLKITDDTYFEKNDHSDNKITCLAASNDATLIAVGLNCGDVEIYKMSEATISFIYNLQSHTATVYDLKFSPLAEVLVSCAEQLCFWHISHVLNNPLELGTKKRRSSRFSSQRSTDIEDAVDAVKIDLSNGHHLQVNNMLVNTLQAATLNGHALENYWQNKRGPANKPELLACIKFVGNKAEKFYANKTFTQFNVIDNEGVYYHLTLLELDHNQRDTMEEQNMIISTRVESLPISVPTTPEVNGGYGSTHGQHPLDEDTYDDNVLI